MEWNYAFVHLESGRDIRREQVGSRADRWRQLQRPASHESRGVCGMPISSQTMVQAAKRPETRLQHLSGRLQSANAQASGRSSAPCALEARSMLVSTRSGALGLPAAAAATLPRPFPGCFCCQERLRCAKVASLIMG